MHTTRPDYERAASNGPLAQAVRLEAMRLREDVLRYVIDEGGSTFHYWRDPRGQRTARMIVEGERQAHEDALRSVVRASGSPYVARGVEATGEPLERAALLERTTLAAGRRAA
jgi:hypothetical protein